MINHFNSVKDKITHDHLKICKKKNDKIQHHFIIKTLNNLGTEKNCFNIKKATYEKPTANIFNIEKLKAFPLRSLSLILFVQ